ncbi:MAG TPA: response regulator [Algoriphagus sp.]|nr:response regulator [Algoriphagus sp.]QYH41165.1 response regulator [Algoriphagus sp. NBT04N3]MAL15211.1 two-component system response regulator [Algoriphagus sp.]MAN85429.1 two-component system response regulator [Algoriphagus sp.]HAD50078.1 response regulator [Algoriphagus sp.]HAS60216.1 response regulator [Algoriphagus sp.]
MRPINIMLIEDNEGDIILIQDALEEAKILNNMTIARDGAEAIEKLEKLVIETPNNLPDLILLDINLPKKNGHEVLEILKSNSRLKQIPIIVLTTSSSELDIFKAYDLHANCYIIKPVEISEFLRVVSKIEDFWLSVVKLPKPARNEEG